MKGGDLPRSWRRVSFTNSPKRWKIRLEAEPGERPQHHDLPWHFETEEEASAMIQKWKEAREDPTPIHESRSDTDRD